MKYKIEYDYTTDEFFLSKWDNFQLPLGSVRDEGTSILWTEVETETACSAFLIGYSRISKYWQPKKVLQ